MSQLRLFVFLFCGISTYAQNALRLEGGKELFFGLGLTNAVTDVGGFNSAGKVPLPNDINLLATRGVIILGVSWPVTKSLFYKGSLQCGNYSGSDKLTNDLHRNYRNLHFKTSLFELSDQIEWTFFEYGCFKWGQRRKKIQKLLSYHISGGLTVFYYKPKAVYDNVWYDLRSLSTEGQGLAEGLEKYSRISLGIPLGIGIKINLNKFKLSIDFIYNKTFTDYLDDVSGYYFDNALIVQERGEIAGYFADPSNGENPDWTTNGAIRGNPHKKDAYLQLIISLRYRLTPRF